MPSPELLPAPPDAGLTRTVARSACYKGLDAVKASLAVAAAVTAVVLAKSAGHGSTPELILLATIMVASMGFIVLRESRRLIWAGEGWVGKRGLMRTTWLRSDQVAFCKTSVSGVDKVIVLRDVDGRKIGLLLSDLRSTPELRRQVRQDLTRSTHNNAVGDLAALLGEL